MKRRRSSSTSNFSQGLQVLIFLAGFLVLAGVFGRALLAVNREATDYPERKWEEYKALEPNSLDVLIMGPSTAYHSLDPKLMEEMTGLSVFNMGSPLQKPKESYYVLKDLVKTQKPKFLVYDFYWGVFNDEKYLNSKLFNYQQMDPSREKVAFFFKVFTPDQYGYALFPMMVYHNSTEKVIDVLGGRVDNFPEREAYREKYLGRGFERHGQVWDGDISGLFDLTRGPEEFSWSEEELSYMDKLYGLCEREGIEMVAITSPLAPEYMEAYRHHLFNYGSIHATMEDWTKQWGVAYRDYNEGQLDLEPKDFTDTHHLNYEGAQKVTRAFVEEFLPQDKGE